MKRYIIDASVLLTAILGKNKKIATWVKGIFSEATNKKAELYSSSFLALEFANGIRFSLKDHTEAVSVYDKFVKLPLKLFSFNQEQIKEVLKLSYQLKTTVYDTSYHYLAKLLGGTFITCDKQYYQKARKLEDVLLLT